MNKTLILTLLKYRNHVISVKMIISINSMLVVTEQNDFNITYKVPPLTNATRSSTTLIYNL